MQIHSDRFETVLPKKRFFNSPKTKQAPKQDWRSVIITGIIAVTVIAALKQINSHQPAPVITAAPVASPTPAWTPPPSDPVVMLPRPVLASPSGPPRAQLVHIRPIGFFERDQMPDGRVLGTTYRGELRSAANLPRSGGQPGDMWFTRADGHCWVLAPVAAGSSTLGWVDP